MSEQEALLKENRFLRQKLMQLQNLFLQLVIACASQPSSINGLFNNINAVLNEASQTGVAGGGAAPTGMGPGTTGGAGPGNGSGMGLPLMPHGGLGGNSPQEGQNALPPTPTCAHQPATLDPQGSGLDSSALLSGAVALANNQPGSGPANNRQLVQLCLEVGQQALTTCVDGSSGGGGANNNAMLLPSSAAALGEFGIPGPTTAQQHQGMQHAARGSGEHSAAAGAKGGGGGGGDPSMSAGAGAYADLLLDVPQKPFLDYLCTIEEIWREFKYGDRDLCRPSIMELDAKYGDKWRKKEFVRDMKELKSRQNLYNKRKCVWVEVQYYMEVESLSEVEGVARLQREVNEFGKGLSRFIDTVLRERQKARRGEPGMSSQRPYRDDGDGGDTGDDGMHGHQDKRQRTAGGSDGADDCAGDGGGGGTSSILRQETPSSAQLLHAVVSSGGGGNGPSNAGGLLSQAMAAMAAQQGGGGGGGGGGRIANFAHLLSASGGSDQQQHHQQEDDPILQLHQQQAAMQHQLASQQAAVAAAQQQLAQQVAQQQQQQEHHMTSQQQQISAVLREGLNAQMQQMQHGGGNGDNNDAAAQLQQFMHQLPARTMYDSIPGSSPSSHMMQQQMGGGMPVPSIGGMQHRQGSLPSPAGHVQMSSTPATAAQLLQEAAAAAAAQHLQHHHHHHSELEAALAMQGLHPPPA